jgi:hypothetical protein
MTGRLVAALTVAAAISVSPQTPAAADAYDALLHSDSLSEQRTALRTISRTPRLYLPRLRQSLRDYPRLVVSDPRAAGRAVTLATYLRDPVFVSLLLDSLGHPDVEAGCAHACPVVLALTVHAAFGGWTAPLDLNPGLTTVHDFQAAVERMARLSLAVVPVKSLTAGAGSDPDLSTVDGKSERQLIEMAGPQTSSFALRRLAALALQASVTTSVSRRELYLLAMNNIPDDASERYLQAVYEAIYRAEFARSHGR